MDEVHRLGVRVTAHATSDGPAWRAVEAGVDAVEHGYQLADSILARMQARGVAVVPTFTDLDTVVISPRACATVSVDAVARGARPGACRLPEPAAPSLRHRRPGDDPREREEDPELQVLSAYLLAFCRRGPR